VLLQIASKSGKKELEVECSASGKSGAGADSEAKTPPCKIISKDGQHTAASPALDLDVEAQGPIRMLQVDGVHTAPDAPQGDAGAACPVTADAVALATLEASQQADAQMVVVQLEILTGMASALAPAVKATSYFSKVFQTIATLQTTLELAINATIMAFSSIPEDKFLDLSDSKNAILAVLAAINGVLKGIDMKLQFEVRKAEATQTDTAFKKIKSKVDTQIIELNALQQPLAPEEFTAYKTDFQALVNKYAQWLGVIDTK
jgi:hypothetical protein